MDNEKPTDDPLLQGVLAVGQSTQELSDNVTRLTKQRQILVTFTVIALLVLIVQSLGYLNLQVRLSHATNTNRHTLQLIQDATGKSAQAKSQQQVTQILQLDIGCIEGYIKYNKQLDPNCPQPSK
jgi:Flp pilus assembly protein CpaB